MKIKFIKDHLMFSKGQEISNHIHSNYWLRVGVAVEVKATQQAVTKDAFIPVIDTKVAEAVKVAEPVKPVEPIKPQNTKPVIKPIKDKKGK
jgi:hypothetical protein